MKNAAQIFAVMQRIVLNVLKQDMSKGSMKGKYKKAGWSEKYLLKLLAKLFKFQY